MHAERLNIVVISYRSLKRKKYKCKLVGCVRLHLFTNNGIHTEKRRDCSRETDETDARVSFRDKSAKEEKWNALIVAVT